MTTEYGSSLDAVAFVLSSVLDWLPIILECVVLVLVIVILVRYLKRGGPKV